MSFNEVVASVQAMGPVEKARLIGILADQLASVSPTPEPVVTAGWQITTDAESLKTFYRAARMPLPNE
jgi:hypothetical protein